MSLTPQASILCIDDDAEACEVLKQTIPCLNFTFAHSFAAALKLIRLGTFDLYLMDEGSPECSGIELCREIRKTDANTPIVILSPAGYPSDEDPAIDAGATAYLDMPADFVLLESSILRLLRTAAARSLDARMAEIAAIRDEIGKHLEELDERSDRSAEKTIDGLRHLLRARAYEVFTDSGGVRSHFDRLWLEMVGNPLEDL